MSLAVEIVILCVVVTRGPFLQLGYGSPTNSPTSPVTGGPTPRLGHPPVVPSLPLWRPEVPSLVSLLGSPTSDPAPTSQLPRMCSYRARVKVSEKLARGVSLWTAAAAGQQNTAADVRGCCGKQDMLQVPYNIRKRNCKSWKLSADSLLPTIGNLELLAS